ncbi:conjugal transfer protein TraD [Anaeroselena agilis]|uniref:Conjugal transfer protein TraD n=1 Tax=Anaeroselena agilis TaxID=3063788 RepID=A0ABU3P2I3_9FIRM|nr:conjugal transfer protein TraD [Selenomonadales bacterium 4137-cl]
MSSISTFATREAARIESLRKRRAEIDREIKVRSANANKVARKADTRDKIELGGLMRIAFETEGLRPDDLDMLLGGLIYVVRELKHNDNPPILAVWKSQGQAERITRAKAAEAKRRRTPITPEPLEPAYGDAPICPACGKGHIVPREKLGGKLGCDQYPACKYIAPEDEG